MSAVFFAKFAQQLLEFTPKAIGFPLAKMPFSLKAKAISQLLELLLAEQAADDELGFLMDKWVAIRVEDINLAPPQRRITISSSCSENQFIYSHLNI